MTAPSDTRKNRSPPGPPQTISRLLAEGSLPGTGTAQQAAQLLKSEQQRWAAVVREAHVKVD